MSKINYSKIEEALNGALLRMNIDKLLEEAVLANLVQEKAGKAKRKEPDDKAVRHLLAEFNKELQKLKKHTPEIYGKIAIDPIFEKKLIGEPQELSSADWKLIKEIKETLENLRQKIRSKESKPEDEKLVEQERKKQERKRFNVKDTWLPLR